MRNQKGMSLVEVLVVAGLTSIIGLAIASMLWNSVKATKQVDQKSEAVDLASQIGLMVQDSGSCGLAIRNGSASGAITLLGGGDFTPINLTTLQSCNPKTQACVPWLAMATPASNFTSGLRLNAMTLRPRTDATGAAVPQSFSTIRLIAPAWSTTPAVAVSYNRIDAEIAVDLRKTNPNLSVGSDVFQTIKRRVTLMVNQTSNQIDSCYGFDTEEYTCVQLLGGTFDVNASPACKLNNFTSNAEQLGVNQLSGSATAYSAVLGESATKGGNLALYGKQAPGITFGDGTSANNYVPPPLDSGSGASTTNSASIYFNAAAGLTTNTLVLAANPRNSGNVVLTSPGGTVGLWAGAQPAIQVAGAGGPVNIGNNRNVNTGGNMNASAFYYSSDRRLKKNIVPLNSRGSVLDRIQKVVAVYYTLIKNDQKAIGVIAQEIQEEFPELVTTNPDGMLAVNYGSLGAIAIEAINELTAIVDEDSERIDKLEAENMAIKARLDALEKKSKK